MTLSLNLISMLFLNRSFVIFCNLNGAFPEFILGRLLFAIGFLHNKFSEMQIFPVDLFPILNYWMGLSYTMRVYIHKIFDLTSYRFISTLRIPFCSIIITNINNTIFHFIIRGLNTFHSQEILFRYQFF